jgi:hypothetical protein
MMVVVTDLQELPHRLRLPASRSLERKERSLAKAARRRKQLNKDLRWLMEMLIWVNVLIFEIGITRAQFEATVESFFLS